MLVITLEKCPIALRGDLTKWLQEISVGVYVGQVSARVRDNLWKRVCVEAKHGKATMVYSARNEQHLEFRVHNTTWEPIDFDGIKLMLRPSASRLREKGERQYGHSAASMLRYKRRKRVGAVKQKEPDTYVVVDLETTGLDAERDEIVEVGAIKVSDGCVVDTLSTVVRCKKALPQKIANLTGIKQLDIDAGAPISDAMRELIHFVRTYPLVMHNGSFDMDFIDVALERLGIDSLENHCIDTLDMAKKLQGGLSGYSLDDLCGLFGIEMRDRHRALPDCFATRALYVRLLEEL